MTQLVEADMHPALHDAFREMLLKVPEQKNIAVLVAYVWEAAVKAERDRCANVCETLGPELIRWWGDGAANAACQECAQAIRGA